MGYGSESGRFAKKLFSTDGVDFAITISDEMA
jgi:hypothetical protein